MRLSAKLKTAVPLFIALLFVSMSAHAAIDNAGIFDTVLTRYSNAAAAWAGVVIGYASWLYWTLVLISMVWTFGMLAMKRSDMGEFLAEFVRFTIFTGFFWWLLTNGPAIAVSFMDSLRQIAGDATGLGGALTPSGVVDIGFSIFDKVLDESSTWSPVDSTVGILMALAILVVLALVAVNMLLLLIAGWILAYGGVFFLGFGGSRWTSDIAINYYKTAIGVGAQLMGMVFLVGIGKTFLDDYYAAMSGGVVINELAVVMIVALILLMLVNKIPSLLAGIITGASVGGGGVGAFGAGAALGAAGMAAAAAAVGGAMIAGGAASAVGGGQAFQAAFSKARESVAGGDALGSFGGSGGSGSGGDGGGGGGSTGDASPFAMASGTAQSASGAGFGGGSTGGGTGPGWAGSGSGGKSSGGFTRAAKVTAGTGANLMRGAGSVAADKIIKPIKERVGETFGGQVAEKIKSRGSSETGQETPHVTTGGSMSGEGDKTGPEAEVAAFANRENKGVA